MIRTNNYTQDFYGPRSKALVVFMFVFGLILIYRLADLQIGNAGEIKASAAKQHSTARVLPAERGGIYYGEAKSDQVYPLAVNRGFNHLYAIPQQITDSKLALDKLWPLLRETGISQEALMARLSKENDIYEPLAHKLTDVQLQPFKDLQLPGIAWETETWRFYPENEILANVVGFVGVRDNERVGQYGLEGFFDDRLKGVDGFLQGATDTYGRLLQTSEPSISEPEPGVDLFLTIDRNIETQACQKLQASVDKFGAAGGQVVVMNPKTGAMLAICASPTFNPNNYNKVEDISVYLNSVISAPYEPGSTFKSITMSAAIDYGSLEPDSTYIDEGYVEFGKYTIRNADNKAHGQVDMAGVLRQSLNTGAIFIEQSIGNNRFRNYVEKFGFGEQTGIDLGGESKGDTSSLEKDSDIFFATASYGQGITVTPLQILAAYGALANQGKLMKPYIVQEIRQKGQQLFVAQPEVAGQPVSVRAATIVSAMLVSVVKDGHPWRAGVKGYHVAGKTGTAQVAEGGEYGEKTIHSFIGYAPVDDPAFVMLVKLDYPRVNAYAESTAAPLFGEIAEFILQYYEIPPDQPQAGNDQYYLNKYEVYNNKITALSWPADY